MNKTLRKNYENACSAYLDRLLEMWDWDKFYGFWGQDEIGGVFHWGDDYSLTMDEIVYCVDNDVDVQEYVTWQDYNLRAAYLGINTVSLRSWLNGCPRMSEEELTRLEKLKKELLDEIDKANTILF